MKTKDIWVDMFFLHPVSVNLPTRDRREFNVRIVLFANETITIFDHAPKCVP